MSDEKTSIRIKKKTLKRLSKLGHHKESYDDIINRIITFWKDPEGTGGAAT